MLENKGKGNRFGLVGGNNGVAGDAGYALLNGEVLKAPSASGTWGEKGGGSGRHAVEGYGGDLTAETGKGGT